MQVSAFLAGLFHSRLIKRVLIVVPKKLLAHWTKELSVVGLKHQIRDYSGPNKSGRHDKLQCAFKEGGVLLTAHRPYINWCRILFRSKKNFWSSVP
ncbi:protein CHROMATIN REMODELING 24-like [Panicum virgatum]|uniref:protein CHROMATIN REMODELING 24-like n=1 Tax=Panicum virgatum TaxID=38727 RepID=UPI0019D6898F|nr:protein CHROMATIN REMODELING 24-like [Panicum virgatum]